MPCAVIVMMRQPFGDRQQVATLLFFFVAKLNVYHR